MRILRRLMVLLLAVAGMALPVVITPASPASAATPNGLIFVACSPSDVPTTTQYSPNQYPRTWTMRTDADLLQLIGGPMRTYFRRATLGHLTNINYFGWVKVDQKMADFTGPNSSPGSRWQVCRDKAACAPQGLPANYGVVVMVAGAWCLQGAPGWACVGTGSDPADIAHEASHALGLNHSWGGTPTKEYGDYYSITGYSAGGYQYKDAQKANWGPGYSAPDLQRLGYLSSSQIASYGWPGAATKYTFTLTALSHYLDGGVFMAQINSGLGTWMTIEFRMPDGPDAGLPGNAIVIHEVGYVNDERLAIFAGGSSTYRGMSIKTSGVSNNKVTVTVANTYPSTVYTVKGNGDLMCNRHLGYATGDASWNAPVKVGNGWGGFKQLFSVSGSIYGLTTDGRLLWYRHYDPDNCTYNWNDKGGTVVRTGLTGVRYMFGMPSAEIPGGIMYAVMNDGRLLWFRHDAWDNGANLWTGPYQVGFGWQSCTKVFPGAEGVIYCTTSDGTLWWYNHLGYKTGANTWQGWRNQVGTGWNNSIKYLVGGSPEGVIYVVYTDGTVRWYRHYGWADGTFNWDPASGTVVNFGWKNMTKVFQRTWTPERPVG